MNKWFCLRDCFTNSRFFNEGRTYELPDTMVKNPKNFRSLDGIKDTQTGTSTIVTVVMEPSSAEPTVETIRKEFKCSVCGKVVRTRGGLKRHTAMARHSPRTKEKVDVSTN